MTKTRIAIAALLTLGVLALTATPAFAGKQYVSGISFGAKGPGAGQLEGPEGVAIGEAGADKGDIYVADTGNRRIDELTAAGDFVMAFGKGVGSLGEDTCTVTCKAGVSGSGPGEFEAPRYIAVDPTSGDLYVGDTGDDVISKFSEAGAYEARLTGTCANRGETPPSCSGFAPFGELGGVAVGPAGELWVREPSKADGEPGKVDEFSHTGVFEEAFPTEETDFPGVAVDSSGDVYVSGPNRGEKYASGMFLSEFPSRPAALDATALAVNPATNGVLAFQSEDTAAGQDGNDVQLFGAFAEPSAPVETFGGEGLSPSDGIAVDGGEADYPLYVTQPATDTVLTYDYLQLPEVASVPASSVEVVDHETVSATLNGTVNPNELPVTACEFEYGTSTAYGHSVPCEQSPQSLGEGEIAKPVRAKIADLLPDTTYHFRLRAANRNDEREQPNPSSDESFPTPGPSVVSEAPAADVTASTAELAGEVNPGELLLGECRFEYGTSALYGESVPCEPGAEQIGFGTMPVEVYADLKGLLGGTTYHWRLVAASGVAGAGEEFKTATVPVIAGGEAREVTGSGAELHATVNPEGLPVSHCSFEYGTSTTYGRSVRCGQSLAQIGYGTEPVPVSAQLTGLESSTAYYWRLSVRDENGEAYEPGHSFNALTGGEGLPDNRSYEMVTPPFKNGALLGDVFFGAPYDISEGEGPASVHPGPLRVIALSIQCLPGSQSCDADRGVNGEPVELTRSDEGWETTPLAPPATEFRENSPWAWSADAGAALFSLPTGKEGEDEWYARSPAGSFSAIGPATPPGIAGVESFREAAKEATADLSHIVWETSSVHTEGIWPFDKTKENASLYEYAGVREGAHNEVPLLVGVTGSAGSHELISTCATELGYGLSANFTPPAQGGNALSADGRTVYFTANPKGTTNGREEPCSAGSGANTGTPVPVYELYARLDGEEADAHTVAISQPDAPQLAGEGARGYASPPDENCTSTECRKDISDQADWRNAEFYGASEDGAQVFFSSSQRLTDEATQGSDNLYLYDFDEPAGHNLIDASAPERSGESPRVQGVVAVSADGSHVYFVAQGVLTTKERPGCRAAFEAEKVAQEGRCHAVGGADNLYVYERDAAHPEGHIAFVAASTATPADDSLRESPANVTPDGRFLVFEAGDLTPDAHAGGTQIYRYDAATEELVRVSVGQGGFDDDGNGGTGDALIVPASDGAQHAGPVRGDPTMSNDGDYVFFESYRALTPHALDDVPNGIDVYEWELAGTPGGSCPTGAPGGGCVYLISDGRDTGSARTPCSGAIGDSATCLLGTDASGHDVFFTTADQLVPKDTDTQVDVYDARICEPEQGNPCVTEPPPALPPCAGEQCHGIPEATPSLLAPGTATFNGEGNVPTSPPPAKPAVKKKTVKCKSGFVRKKVKKKEACVKKKSKKRAKKSTNDRRAR